MVPKDKTWFDLILNSDAELSGTVEVRLTLKGDPSSLTTISPPDGLPLALETERYGPAHIRVRVTRPHGTIPPGSTTIGTLEIDADGWSGFQAGAAEVIDGDERTPLDVQLVRRAD